MRSGAQPVAMVIMRSPRGRPPDEELVVGKLEAHLPDETQVREVRDRLADADFDVGPTLGLSFSITGPPGLFVSVLGIDVHPSPDGGWTTDSGREIAGDDLPVEFRSAVRAVAFEEPSDMLGGMA